MDRMVKADSEASKAQTDVNKAQKAIRQLETDVDALRFALWLQLAMQVQCCYDDEQKLLRRSTQ